MIGGINPSQMKAMMNKMGIKQEEIDALRVIIEKEDSRVIIENPNVVKMIMQGQVSWQITGEEKMETKESEINDEDIKLVMEKTGKNEKEVRKALNETKDIAEAIVKLSQ